MPELSLLTLNIATPSLQRAERQLSWLAARDEDVLVLTETKDSAGCRLIADAFSVAGYHVSYPKPDYGDYGVMIVSRVQARGIDFGDRLGYLVSRAAAITLPTVSGAIQVIGVYVPSRDASVEKTERKRKWLAACNAALASRDHSQPAIFLGDLNVVEPEHQPRYKFFAPFEYEFYQQLTDDCGLIDAFRALHPEKIQHSWVGRTGDGYRYDHVHCTGGLAAKLVSCDYLHQTRTDRLSDHSALSVRLAIEASQPLITSAPATASASPTLF
jgi:exodeoxyribonuclease-3